MKGTDGGFYDDMLTLNSSAVYRCDGPERIITFFAGAADRLTGLAPEKMIGLSLNAMAHGQNSVRVSGLADASAGDGEYYAEYRLTPAGRPPVWIGDRGRRTVRDGMVTTEGMLTDITQQKRARVGRDNLVRKLNREIRTPMSSVIGFLELAIDTLDDDDVIGGYLLRARQAAVSMLRMLNDISYISDPADKPQKGEIHVFCLGAMLEDMTAYLADRAQQTGTSVELRRSADMPECYRGDSKKIRRIMSVLTESAMERSPEGRVLINAGYSDGLVTVSVEDSGAKLTKREQREFFIPGKISKNGSSIRMAVAKVLAAQTGGGITVRNTRTGNAVILAVPMTPENCEGGCAGTCYGTVYNSGAIKEFSRGMRVLLAEDVDENAELAIFRLRRRGHSVDLASDGEEAVSMFADGGYDIVLMDLHMPGMDGIKAMKTIRTMAHGKYVPVIGMTSSPMPKDRHAALEAGMDTVFVKPIDFQLLFEKMEQLVPPDAGYETRVIRCVGEEGADLSCVDGYINVKEGVRIWGSGIMFANALLDFAERYGDCCSVVATAMSQDMREAHKYVHRLKNIVAGFACPTLSEKLSDIESWLYAGDKEVAGMMLDGLREEMEIFNEKVSGLKI